MDKILETAPNKFIPPSNTKAFLMLELLSDGLAHDMEELLSILGCDPRSARQALTGKQYGYWLIHNDGRRKGKYRLDKRHLSRDLEQDNEARIIAFKALKERSKNQSEKEKHRFPIALKELEDAKAIYQRHFKFSEEKPNPA